MEGSTNPSRRPRITKLPEKILQPSLLRQMITNLAEQMCRANILDHRHCLPHPYHTRFNILDDVGYDNFWNELPHEIQDATWLASARSKYKPVCTILWLPVDEVDTHAFLISIKPTTLVEKFCYSCLMLLAKLVRSKWMMQAEMEDILPGQQHFSTEPCRALESRLVNRYGLLWILEHSCVSSLHSGKPAC